VAASAALQVTVLVTGKIHPAQEFAVHRPIVPAVAASAV
jgi:hypothetical protein